MGNNPSLSKLFKSRLPSAVRLTQIEFSKRTDGVEAVKEKRFYAWNELDKIEIIPGTIGTRATPTYIAFIQGNNVVAIATNLKKNEIENIKGLFQRYGVKIAVKQ